MKKIIYSALILFYLSFSLLANEGGKISKDISAVFRGYFTDDQRIFWSGLEMSFGVEAVLRIDIKKQIEKHAFFVESEFFLNQPYGKNILTDDERKRYIENFKIPTFEISKLNIGYKNNNMSISIGKNLSPFGRMNYPLFLNNYKIYSPFIRSEAILLRETGLFFHWKPLIFSIDLAIVNGEENRDTNSFKGGIARLGFDFNFLKIGVSVKAQDGIGSEQQKEYKNHLGADFLLKIGWFSISGEVIYDQYGFHREFNEKEMFWSSSFYYRDIFYKYKTPIEGKGGYINLKFEKNGDIFNLSYGEYYPRDIGYIYHDQNIKRFILKIRKNLTKNLSMIIMGVKENERKYKEPWRNGEKGYAFTVGFEFKTLLR
jgi:hypothetical protein